LEPQVLQKKTEQQKQTILYFLAWTSGIAGLPWLLGLDHYYDSMIKLLVCSITFVVIDTIRQFQSGRAGQNG
jgi:hypothetical protein